MGHPVNSKELRSNSSTCSSKVQPVQPKIVMNHLNALFISKLPREVSTLKFSSKIITKFENIFFSLFYKIMWDILYKATKYWDRKQNSSYVLQYTSWRKRKKKVMMTSHKMKWSKSFVPPQLFYFRNFPFGPPKLWVVLFSFITGSILNKCGGKYKKRCTYNSSFPFIELFNCTFRQFMYFLVAIL